MKLKPYPEYKDSGIQWIGKIPEGWEINKIKHNVLPLQKSGLEASEGNEEGVYPFFTSSQIQSKFIDKAVFNGECLIVGTGGFASVHYYKGKFSASNDCLILRGEKLINMKFLYYQILSNLQVIDDLGFWGTGLRHLQKYFFYNILFYFPKDKQYQTAIANYLDKKTAKINKLIEKDKKLIALLKEKRTALINHAVTKGLDPNVKLKDSGIQWIGKIPEGWSINKIKNTSYVKGRIGWHGLTSEEYSCEGAYLVTGTDFKNGFVEWENCYHIGWDRYKEDPYIHLKENDLLITKDGTIGKVALVKNLPDKATLNSGIFLVRPINKKYITRFMFWMLNSAVFERFFDYIKTGATISHLYQETFERFFFPVPPLPEQSAIANYLDKTTTKIDKTIEKIEQKIKLLEEYKKSLIHHVVTGKVDVRGVEA